MFLEILGSGTPLCIMMQKRHKIEVTKIYWVKKPFLIHSGLIMTRVHWVVS